MCSSDLIDKAKSEAQKLKKSIESGLKETPQNNSNRMVLEALDAKVGLFLGQTTIDQLRIEFGNISKVLVNHFKTQPNEARLYQLFFCPMFPKGYAFWIQPLKEELRNPYWGKEMLECGVMRPW